MQDNAMVAGQQGTILSHIAQSLAHHFASIYYIDTIDDSYVEFAASDVYKELNIAPEGTDFFAETRRNNMRLVHPDDIDLLADVCDKEALLERTAGGQTYTVTYRLLMEDGPTYTRLSAMMADDGRHIIIGVTDVDEQVRRELAVRAAEERHVTYSHIAQTLAKRYAAIYYVDAQTSAYVEFSSSGTFRELGLPSSGADFFAAADEAFSRMVHPDDAAVASDLLDARRLVERLSNAKPTVATFRLMLSVGDVWASMRVMWAEDRRHLIVGLSDVDDQVKAERAAHEAEERGKVYGHIAKSLANRYATIYFVDIYTKHYIEFSSSDTYKNLQVEPSGDDFFEISRVNVRRVIHPDDLDQVMAVLDRDRMTEIINRDGHLSITYRLMLNGRPVYTNMNAVWADDRRHVIIGVSDVDAEIKREMEQREAEERTRIYGYIAQSLAHQYATIYYVDVYTENYLEFTSSDVYRKLDVPESGASFFDEARRNAERVIHPDDLAEVVELMDRERMTRAINAHGSVSLTYRLLLGDGYVYTNLRAVWADDMRHLIVGVSDVDAAVRKEQAHREVAERSITYAHIAQSLANRYDSILYVDAQTNAYTEYSSTEEYKRLGAQTEGDDFFADTAENVRRLVFREDMDFALNAVEKGNMLRELELAGQFSVNYRLMMRGKPTYINLRAMWADDKRHLIVGVSNVDAELRREYEHARNLQQAHEQAMRDALTGVRNKNGYQEFEKQLQVALDAGRQQPFAIVVCDVNGLKEVNDTQGHKAGDEYICAACALICDIYAHSPVFRIGGDEFVAILRGKDFEKRDALLEAIRSEVRRNQITSGVVIASGMSDYREGVDRKVADVFARADELMYENKRTLKGIGD